MSKAMSIEMAAKLVACKNDNTSFFNPNNKYGYRININHPDIKEKYELFKKKRKAIILSDDERFEFEAAILKMIEKARGEKNESI